MSKFQRSRQTVPGGQTTLHPTSRDSAAQLSMSSPAPGPDRHVGSQTFTQGQAASHCSSTCVSPTGGRTALSISPHAALMHSLTKGRSSRLHLPNWFLCTSTSQGLSAFFPCLWTFLIPAQTYSLLSTVGSSAPSGISATPRSGSMPVEKAPPCEALASSSKADTTASSLHFPARPDLV